MSKRDSPNARQHLQTASSNALDQKDEAQLAASEAILARLDDFWQRIRSAVPRLEPGQELILRDREGVEKARVAVVESSPGHLRIQAAGRPQEYQLYQLPSSLLLAIAEQTFASDVDGPVLLATFLAIDINGDRQHAQRLLREAAKAGFDVQAHLSSLDLDTAVAAPPTDPRVLRDAQRVVQQSFATQYANANGSVQRIDLARQLLSRAATTTDKPAVRFVLLREALAMATAALDRTLADQAIDQMAKYYRVDTLQLKAQTLHEMATGLRRSDGPRIITQAALDLCDEALEAGRLDLAAQMAEIAGDAARRSRSVSLIKRAIAAAQRVEASQQRLKAKTP